MSDGAKLAGNSHSRMAEDFIRLGGEYQRQHGAVSRMLWMIAVVAASIVLTLMTS